MRYAAICLGFSGISTETAQRVYNDVNDGAVFYESVEKTR